MSLLTIVTVANRRPSENYFCFDEFFASARKFGHEPLVLGKEPGEYRGLGSKPKLLKRALDAGKITTPYVLFVDCFDVVFASDPDALTVFDLDALVIGAETNCFPDASLADQHPESGTRFRYVNSGFMFGRTEAMKEFLAEMNPEQYLDDGETDANLFIVQSNDQDTVMRMHLFGKTPTQLDTSAYMVANLCGLGPDDIELTPLGVRVTETQTYPVAWHFNGNAKTSGLREIILKHLGY